jgi:hypothetical protein
MKRRAANSVCAVVVIGLGLASRRHGSSLPPFVSEYAGDTLWALTVLLVASAIAPRMALSYRAAAALVFAFSIEISQLYHAPWIDAIRNTPIGSLVLGFGFLWSDLACYTVGVSIGVCIEWVLSGNRIQEL